MLVNLPKNDVHGLAAEIIVSLVIMFIMASLSLIIGHKAKKADPTKRPKGILVLAEWAVEMLDAFSEDALGKDLAKLSPYFGALAVYIFVSFTISIIGLPSPVTNLMVPLSLAICSFLLIHIVSAYYKRWKYFKRFVEPIFIFLPLNLVSMWAPIISLTFRMFGNALIGLILMALAYWALEGISTLFFGGPYYIAPFIAPFLHAYFDIFTAFIQTMVFVTLTMLFISQEKPQEEDEVSSTKENEVTPIAIK